MTIVCTDTDYAAFKDGLCVGIATKFAGPGAEALNGETLDEWIFSGYEIREMPRDEAVDAHIHYLSSLRFSKEESRR